VARKKTTGTRRKKEAGPASTGPFSDAIRSGIRARGWTAYRASKVSGVTVDPIQHFLNGTRNLSLVNADRLAVAMGLVVTDPAAEVESGDS
jgi:hypothetical protein